MSSNENSQKTSEKFLIAIDPGLNFCGLVVADQQGNFRVRESNLVNNSRAFSPEAKLVEQKYGSRTVKVQAILAKINAFLANYEVDTIVIEAPFYNRMTPAVYGALLEIIYTIKYLVVIPRELQLFIVEPTLVKRLFTAKGSADKAMMRNFMKSKSEAGEIQLDVDLDAMSEHEVDAAAIAYIHRQTLLNTPTA